jgi:hypothetical protein
MTCKRELLAVTLMTIVTITIVVTTSPGEWFAISNWTIIPGEQPGARIRHPENARDDQQDSYLTEYLALNGNVQAVTKNLPVFEQATRKRHQRVKHSSTDDYQLGDNKTFVAFDSWKAYNGIDDDTDGLVDFDQQDWDEGIYEFTATVMAISEGAVIFHDVAELDEKSAENDTTGELLTAYEENIFPTVMELLGNVPDIDGDGKIIIAVTDIRDALYHGRGNLFIGGYFWPLHSTGNTGESIFDYSMEAEIVFLDVRSFDQSSGYGGDYPPSLLAHEFQHLVHFSVDDDVDLWFDEGLSVLAQWTSGYPGTVTGYINAYTLVPTTSLTYSTEDEASYGIAFLMVYYLRELAGTDKFKELAREASDLEGIASSLASAGLTSSSVSLFLQFAMALGAGGKGGHPALPVQVPFTSAGNEYPVVFGGNVQGWSIDYWELPGTGYPAVMDLTFLGDQQATGGWGTVYALVAMEENTFKGEMMTELFAVDAELDTGRALINGAEMVHDRVRLATVLLAGDSSGNGAATSVPTASYSLGINLTDGSRMETGEMITYPRTNSLVYAGFRCWDSSGTEITGERVNSSQYQVLAGETMVSNGSLTWDNDTGGWKTGKFDKELTSGEEVRLKLSFAVPSVTGKELEMVFTVTLKEVGNDGSGMDTLLVLVIALSLVVGGGSLVYVWRRKPRDNNLFRQE